MNQFFQGLTGWALFYPLCGTVVLYLLDPLFSDTLLKIGNGVNFLFFPSPSFSDFSRNYTILAKNQFHFQKQKIHDFNFQFSLSRHSVRYDNT